MPIELKNISFIYNEGAPGETVALSDINLTFREGEFVGIIGHTGSGKSTMIQLLNGLVAPTHGQVLVDGVDIHEAPNIKSKKKKKREIAKRMLKIRQKVGLVFQYPEHQLFEMTVAKDIAFGPHNMGLSEEEIEERVASAMKLVGLDESYREKSPFELSGGQKRRVAIAGVAAMGPDFLVLDEPTAGLDPKGRDEILSEVKRLGQEEHIAVILVSHSMDDVARFCDRVVAMEHGRVIFDGTPSEVYAHGERLTSMGLGVPKVTELGEMLKEKGFEIDGAVLNLDQMEEILVRRLKG